MLKCFNTFTLNMNKIFDCPNIHILNRSKVHETIDNIIKDGSNKLQVIADFDRTLTRSRDENGKAFATCHNTLEECQHLPLEYRNKSKEMLNFYHQIEIDPKISVEEKIPYMVEWWEKSHTLLIQYKLTCNQIIDIVQNSNIKLRKGVTDLFCYLHKKDIPLMIFSAGIGDIIEIAIKDQCKLYENIHIVSNYMKFDDQGYLIGFQDTMIHTFNKNERSIRDSEYFTDLNQRTNILLVGDSIGDLNMADGAKNANNILKIGYLNDKVDCLLEEYKNKYDIVITGDGDVSLIQTLLNGINGKKDSAQ